MPVPLCLLDMKLYLPANELVADSQQSSYTLYITDCSKDSRLQGFSSSCVWQPDVKFYKVRAIQAKLSMVALYLVLMLQGINVVHNVGT